MTYLLLAITASTVIALMLKHNDVKHGDTMVLLASNYVVATVVGTAMLFADGANTYSVETVALGAVLGLGFVGTFFIFSKAIGAAGTALATVSSRLSLVIPVVLSIVIYHELPSALQIWGLALSGVTLMLFYVSLRAGTDTGKHHEPVAYVYLFVLTLGIGLNDFGFKLFNEWRPPTDKPLFVASIFGFALIYSAAYVLWKRTPLDRVTIGRGFVLGIPNVLSSIFLLAALAQLDAIVVYPSINIGIILATAVLAAIIWDERLNRFGMLALAVGSAAIVLMGMGV